MDTTTTERVQEVGVRSPESDSSTSKGVVLEVPGKAINTGEQDTTVAVEIVQLPSDLWKQRRTNRQLHEFLLVLNKQIVNFPTQVQGENKSALLNRKPNIRVERDVCVEELVGVLSGVNILPNDNVEISAWFILGQRCWV
jgi:hypothetical protein